MLERIWQNDKYFKKASFSHLVFVIHLPSAIASQSITAFQWLESSYVSESNLSSQVVWKVLTTVETLFQLCYVLCVYGEACQRNEYNT